MGYKDDDSVKQAEETVHSLQPEPIPETDPVPDNSTGMGKPKAPCDRPETTTLPPTTTTTTTTEETTTQEFIKVAPDSECVKKNGFVWCSTIKTPQDAQLRTHDSAEAAAKSADDKS